MALFSTILLFLGLAIVIYTADVAVKRLLNISKYFRLSDFVISFLIAGIIAVLPELSIGVISAFEGTSSLGFGVILGANVADLTLVLGVVLLLSGKLELDPATTKNIRISFLAVVLPIVLFIDGEISRIDGLILLGAFSVYIYYLLRSKHADTHSKITDGKRSLAIELGVFILSLIFLFVGGNLITISSRDLSLLLGVPLFIIGIIVAIGTCLPETVFAIRAARRKHFELGIGNIFGNVLADSMMAIGIIALIQPIKPQQSIIALSTGLFMVFSAALVTFLSRKHFLTRTSGLILTLSYPFFILIQFLVETMFI